MLASKSHEVEFLDTLCPFVPWLATLEADRFVHVTHIDFDLQQHGLFKTVSQSGVGQYLSFLDIAT
jgi:hypothetical protein